MLDEFVRTMGCIAVDHLEDQGNGTPLVVREEIEVEEIPARDPVRQQECLQPEQCFFYGYRDPLDLHRRVLREDTALLLVGCKKGELDAIGEIVLLRLQEIETCILEFLGCNQVLYLLQHNTPDREGMPDVTDHVLRQH